MLKKQKKLAQKKLIQQDDLITTYETALSFYQTNKKLLTNIGIALVVIIAGGWFYMNNQRQDNEKAALEFAKIFTYYDNGQYQLAMNGLPEKNVRGLLAIVSDYGSTHNGNIARFYLANSYYNLGDYEKAMTEFTEADLPTDILEASRLAGIAACHEAKGNFSEAAKYFERAGRTTSDGPNTAENLAHAARNYAKSGNKEQAIELYKYIKKEHSSSAAARDAERLIDELRS